MTENKTQEEKKIIPGEEDLEERIKGFNKELLPLLGKYELGIGSTAFVSPDGLVLSNPTIMSNRKKPKTEEPKEESPKITEEKKEETLTNPEA